MIKVFIPEIKGRVKTNVRGLWLNDKGKLFYDYLGIKIINTFFNRQRHKLMVNKLNNIRLKYNQEALFFSDSDIGYDVGYILNNDLTITELNNKIYVEVKHLRAEIKEALRVYGGVTIYRVGNKYFKEIYYK
jgi:hypothetical protein